MKIREFAFAMLFGGALVIAPAGRLTRQERRALFRAIHPLTPEAAGRFYGADGAAVYCNKIVVPRKIFSLSTQAGALVQRVRIRKAQ